MKLRPYVWTTREGIRISVRDMDDSHLNNTIAMLQRKADESYNPALLKTKAYRALRTEYRRRQREGVTIEAEYTVIRDDQREIEHRKLLT